MARCWRTTSAGSDPTAGPDGDGTRTLIDLLRGFADDGLTVVLSTQSPGFVSAIGDAFATFDDGQVVHRGHAIDGADAERFGLCRFERGT